LGHAEGSPRQSDAGAEEARTDAADVGGVDRLAELSRLVAGSAVEKEIERDPQHRARGEGPERRPLWSREDQGAHPRVFGGPPVGEEPEGLDPVLRWPSGRG